MSYSACGGEDEGQTGQSVDAGPNRNNAPPVAAKPDASAVRLAEVSPPLACGPSECTRPKNVAADLLMSVTGLPMTGADTVACCLDESEGVCSAAASPGATCDTVAVMDNRCPGVDLSALADLVGGLFDMTRDAMIGCCTHDACGLDGKIFGRGCVENADAKRMLSAVPVIGPLIKVPPPRPCALGPDSDHDAGI
jgi:hypothetical protein